MKQSFLHERAVMTKFRITVDRKFFSSETLFTCLHINSEVKCIHGSSNSLMFTKEETCFVSTNQTSAQKEEDKDVVLHFENGCEASIPFSILGSLVMQGLLVQVHEHEPKSIDDFKSQFELPTVQLFFTAVCDMVIPMYEYSGGGWGGSVHYKGDSIASQGSIVCIACNHGSESNRHASMMHFIDQHGKPFTYPCGNENLGKLLASKTIEQVIM